MSAAGGPAVIPEGWRGVARSLAIYYGVPWRFWLLARFYRRLLRPGELYFDIGAHVGNRIAAALAAGARVVAVEPQPSCVAVLRRLYGRNPRVTLLPEAVGAAPGTATLRVSSRTPTVSTLDPAWMAEVGRAEDFRAVRWDGAVEVPVTTLDALVERFGVPAWCKLDIEGSEPAALAGLSRPLPWVSFEALPAAPDRAPACLERLRALGPYRFNLVRGEATRFALPGWVGAEAMADMLAGETRFGDVHARLSDR